MGKKPASLLQSRFYSWGKLALLGGLLVTVFLVSMVIGMRTAVRGQEVETPALVGMNLTDAEQLFTRLPLKLVISGRRYDDSKPKGSIISQSPGAGVGIKADLSVRVVVSLGRRSNPVPDLRGSSVRAARLLAEQSGYEIGRVSRVVDVGRDDEVIAQWPLPQTEGNVSERIDVLVRSEAVTTFVTPDFVGWNMNRALVFLQEHDFAVEVRYSRYPGTKRGTVVRQYPEPGYPLREKGQVILEVALEGRQ